MNANFTWFPLTLWPSWRPHFFWGFFYQSLRWFLGRFCQTYWTFWGSFYQSCGQWCIFGIISRQCPGIFWQDEGVWVWTRTLQFSLSDSAFSSDFDKPWADFDKHWADFDNPWADLGTSEKYDIPKLNDNLLFMFKKIIDETFATFWKRKFELAGEKKSAILNIFQK